MNHFFVSPENISTGMARITGSDVNHIKNVLRMREGEELLLSDGAGCDYHCKIAEITNESVACEILDTDTARSEPNAKFYLFQGLPKADKLELIIQKSVELGVYEIVPVEMARSIVKYDAKKQKAKQERWQKISEGAAKQSKRGVIPEVKEVMPLGKAIEYCKNEAIDTILVPYENFKDIKETKRIISDIAPGSKVAIFIGPEGGFDEMEVNQILENNGKAISLGNRILRTETAPLMILSVLMFQLEE